MNPVKREWHRFVHRCIWSWAGWRSAWASEPSLKFWTTVVAISSVLALVLPLNFAERTVILPLGVLVLAAELMNTALERAVDYISIEQDDRAGRAKDAGSAAVALTAIAGGIAWAVILWRLVAG
ncbi:MAG: diacylglycerol kinase [Maritimibacter sp.]|nr:diacylglycerol kinase [Maritimibacter sp.]